MTVEPAPAEDATRRTRLANERTLLAWWRTGLAALAVGIGAGKIAPSLAGGPAWPYVAVGVAYAAVGVAFMVYGRLRLRAVEEALGRGAYVSASDRAVAILTAAGVLLGAATVALVVWQP